MLKFSLINIIRTLHQEIQTLESGLQMRQNQQRG